MIARLNIIKMKKINYTFVIILMVAISLSNAVHAQVSINTSGGEPDASSMLDISSTSHGLLIPRMTLAERVNIDLSASPTALLIYQTDNSPGFYYYDGSSWTAIQGGNDSDWTVNGNDMYSAVSGNVGIGVTNPETVLEIASEESYLTLHNTTTENTVGGRESEIRFKGERSGGQIYTLGILKFGHNGDPNNEKSRFEIKVNTHYDGNALATMFSIDDNYGIAMGYSNAANGNFSTAMGYYTETSSDASIAMGSYTKAIGVSSTAMGNQTDATGNTSTAMGSYTEASGNFSTAMGHSSKAIGDTSTAMGKNTEASSYASTAMGSYSKASGLSSTAMGHQTNATGNYSTAMGYYTTASGHSSTAMGYYTTAPSYVETSIGRYNTSYTPASTDTWNTSDRLFVIGNGASSSSKSDAIVVLKNGNMGIGTSNPSCPLEVNGSSDLTATYGYLNSNGETGTAGPQTNAYSIKASHRIMATEFNAVSDKRIKTNILCSNNTSDLQKINNLKVSEYNYIDSIGKGNTLQKGFIAQEVEQFIPEAVNTHSDFIPDVFILATNLTKTENIVTIELPKTHQLLQGDLIRLITPAGQLDKEVLEIVSENSFSVSMTEEPESIFVYGKKVDDFRVVNYDYIFSTGIGAIQELSTKVDELENSNNYLLSKVEQIDKLTAEVEALKSLIIQGSTLAEKTIIE